MQVNSSMVNTPNFGSKLSSSNCSGGNKELETFKAVMKTFGNNSGGSSLLKQAIIGAGLVALAKKALPVVRQLIFEIKINIHNAISNNKYKKTDEYCRKHTY